MNRVLIFLLLSVLLFSVSVYTEKCVEADSGSQWMRSYGGPNREEAECVIQSNDGGFVIVGYSARSSASNSHDFWIVKTDSNGDMQWNRTYGGTDNEEAYCVVQTTDGGYAVVGDVNPGPSGGTDILLVKINVNGDMQWNKTYGGGVGSESHAFSLIQTSDGGYAIAGSFVLVGLGSQPHTINMYLVKTDSSGNKLWERTYGVNRDFARSLIQMSDGGYVLAGGVNDAVVVGRSSFELVKTNGNGYKEWSKTYERGGSNIAYSMVQSSDGGYVLVGSSNPGATSGGGLSAFWLVKTDAGGTMVWNKTYGGTKTYDVPYCLCKTSDQGYAIAGASDGNAWLVKTNSDGSLQWDVKYKAKVAHSVIQLSDGGFALAGYTENSATGWDFVLLKTDNGGKCPEAELSLPGEKPFWTQTWFLTAMAVIIGGIVAGVVFVRRHQKNVVIKTAQSESPT